ncbi:MAG TPA: DUF4386 domain-containing protein [Verrucomicrobiae bacterium]|nr:DUF4386 domain-containing protein [Verrucomicrobiae bacterium]
MAIYTVDESQRKAARVAGLLYLVTILIANLVEFYVRRQIIVRGDAMQTARNISASADLFRLGIAGDVAVLACDVSLIVALYVLLKPINRNLALLAVFWRLVGCCVAAATIAINIAALLLVGSLPAPGAEQLQVFTRLLISLDTGGNRVAALFFGLGSTLFCYLWFKSRFVPRALAGWGIFASLVPAIVPLSTVLLAPLSDAPLRRARAGIPIAIFEAAIGLWLLIKGIPQPAVE